MTNPKFPDPLTATYLYPKEGILAVGDDLSFTTLEEAYQKGIFPWPMPVDYDDKDDNDEELWQVFWFCPPKRAIFEFNNIHIPRSLEKCMRKNPYQIRVNQNFNAVIRHCSQAPRPGQDGTWITDNIIKAYCSLHARGKAHSIEAYDADGKLVGGLYGTDLGGIFAGESMFHLKPNASKIALLHLCRALQTQGFEWIDIQQLTPHMEKLGARQIPRREFIKKLRHEQSKQILFNASAIADLAD